MPFLSLAGYTIPVAAGSGQLETDEVGVDGRTRAGAYSRTRRALKRRWSFETTRLPAIEADLVQQLLEGRGLGVSFNGTSAVDPKTSNGQSGTDAPQVVYHRSTGEDGSPVANAVAVGSTRADPLLPRSVAIDTATTNLLPAGARQGSSAASFTAVDGAVIAVSSLAFWQSTGSLRVTTSAVANGLRGGVRTNAVAASSVTAYTGSVYAKLNLGSGGLRAFLRDVANGIDSATVAATVTADAWVRFEDLTLTTGALATTLELHVLEDVIDSGIDYFVDGLQVEQKAYTSAWADPSTVSGKLAYDARLLQRATGLTINAWVTRPVSGVEDARLAVLTGDVEQLRLEKLSASSNVSLTAFDDSSVASTTLTGALPAPPTWALVTAVLQTTPPSGRAKLELYVNGALTGSTNPATLPSLSKTVEIALGGLAAGGLRWRGAFIDDVSVLPWAASPALIAAWYNSGAGVPAALWPGLRAAGDFAPGEELLVQAVVPEQRQSQFASGGVWQTGARSVRFELWEV